MSPGRRKSARLQRNVDKFGEDIRHDRERLAMSGMDLDYSAC